MPVGLQVFDPAGNIAVDTSDLLGRVLGVRAAGKVNGSINVPGFSTGTGWAAVLPHRVDDVYSPPIWSISGTTLSWSYSEPNAAYRADATIIYGVY